MEAALQQMQDGPDKPFLFFFFRS